MLDGAMRAPDHYSKQGFSLEQLLPAIAHIASVSDTGIKYLLDGRLLRQLAIILNSETLPIASLIGTQCSALLYYSRLFSDLYTSIASTRAHEVPQLSAHKLFSVQ